MPPEKRTVASNDPNEEEDQIRLKLFASKHLSKND